MKRKDSILLKYYSNKLPKHQMTGQVDYKKRQEENLQKSVDFLKDWYTKRATLPQFKNVSERRLNVLEQPIKTRYVDPQIMSARGFAGAYNPTNKFLSIVDTDSSLGDFPEYSKFIEYSTGSPVVTHELFHKLHYEAPQFTDVVPEKITEKIPGYPELTSPEYVNLRTGKLKMGPKNASAFYPEMEAITGMLRQAETIDPIKPVTADDVSSYIKKYDKYSRDTKMKDLEVDKVQEFHRGRLIKQLFDVMGNDPEKIAAYLNSVAKNDNQQDLSLAKWGGLTRYQNGGSDSEELAFQQFFKTLPFNLRKDNPGYNIREYWDALGRPSEFDYSQPKSEDGFYHAFSRHPETGEILKAPFHPTFKRAIEEDRKFGYYPIVTPEGKIKTVSGVDLKPGQSVYASGGITKYGPGGQTTDGCPAGYNKHPLTGECIPNGWVAPMQAGPTVQNAERLRKAAALNRGTTGPTIGQSRSDEPWRQRQAAEMRRQNAQESSALAQTMGLFTPSGYNPAAGVTGAETFVNMNPLITGPIMSTSRLYGAGRSMVDPNTYNPYFSSDKGVVSNILGGLNLAGDVGMLGMTLRNPTGSFNPRVRIATKTKPSDFTERNIRVKQAWADAKKKKAGVPTTAEEYRKFLQDEKLKQQAGDVLREKGMMPDPRTGGSYQAPADKLTWKDPKTGEIIYQLDAENYNDFKTPKDFKEAQQDFRSYKRKYLQDLANQRNAAVNEAKQLGIFGKQFPYDPNDFSKTNLLGGKFPGFDIPDYIENLGFDYPMYYKDFTGATHNISGIDPSELIPYKGLKVTKGLSPNKYGGLVKHQTRGQVNPPIYTDDPKKVKAYQDSLALSNWRFQFPYLITISQGIQYHNTNKERKEYVQSLNEYPWYLAGTSRQNNNLLNRINRTGYLPIGRERIEGELPVFKKPVQPYILQKPGLTRRVSTVEPISVNRQTSTPQLKIPQLPSVQMSPSVPQGNYMVGYIDENNQGVDRGFITPEEREAFVKELEQRNLSSVQPYRGNITQYYRIPKKLNGGLIKHQIKGQVEPPTRSDSLFLLNNNKIIEDLLKTGKYKWDRKIKTDPKNWKFKFKVAKEFWNTGIENEMRATKEKKGKLSDYKKQKGKFIGTSDWLPGGGDDYGHPIQYITSDIVPQFQGDLVSTSGYTENPFIYSYGYEPLAITPWDMLNKKQQQQRLKIYGTSGTPYTEQPQTSKPEEPKLKRKVSMMSPISTQSSYTPSLRMPNIPNIQIPSIQQGKYKVDYFDPTEEGGVQGGWHTNSFMTSADADEYMKQRSADNKFYGPSMTQRVEYANGGLVEYQTRGQVQPTSADSAALYNNTMALLNYYGNKKKYKNLGVYPVPYDVTDLNMSSMKDMKERLKDRKKHPFTARRWNSNLNVAGSLIGGLLGADIETDQLDPDYDFKMSDYYQRLSPYQYKQRELANNIIDTDAPMGLYDTRIEPTRKYHYSNIDDRSGPIAGTNPLYGDFVNFYGYDPALIKPWNMLTDKEKALRSGKPNQSSTTIVNKKSNPVPNKPQISNSKTTSSKIIQKTQPKPKYWTAKDIPTEVWNKFIKEHPGAIGMDPSHVDKNNQHMPIYPSKSEPSLKKKVSKMEPISTKKSSSFSLKLPNIPNIQMSGSVPQGKYRVEYYDPELKQETHRNFMTQAESDAFTNELSKRNLSGVPSAGNITQRVQYRDGGLVKYQKKGEVKKSPITHYVFAEQVPDNAFETEANNLKTFISKNYPGENVVILPGRGDDYFNKTVLPTLGKVGKQDRVYLFGHHGRRYAGVPASLWGNAFEQAQQRAGDFNCYLGSCHASDLAGTSKDETSTKYMEPVFSRLKNFYYRPELRPESDVWLGVNPNAEAVPGASNLGVLNAMYTRSKYNPESNKLQQSLGEYERSFYDNDKQLQSLNKQLNQLYDQHRKDNTLSDKKEFQDLLEKVNKQISDRLDVVYSLLSKDKKYRTLNQQIKKSLSPYITKSPRYGIDFQRSTFNPYINIDQRQQFLDKRKKEEQGVDSGALFNWFPTFAQGGQRFYGVSRFDEGGTPMCKDSFGNPIPCPPGYTAGSMVFATATPAAQDNTRLPKRIEMTDKAAQAKAVSDAHAFNKAWMNSPMYNKMLQASMAASPSSSSDIPELRKVAADPSRINVQIEDLNNPNLGGTTTYRPADSTKLSQVKLNPNSRSPFRESAGHEILGHATDMGGILIPQADKDKMNKYFTPVDNTIDPIAELAKKNNMSYAEQKAIIDEKMKNDPQFAKDWKEITELGVDITNATNKENKYIQKPSETRARLMSIRKVAKERGVYDPLTQKMTKENLRKLKELNNDELDFLFKNYTEDELLDMFNTISMNESSDTQTMARWGGSLKKRSQGGMIEDDMGQLKYPGFPTRIRSKNITMEGVNHPLVAKTNRGITKLLLPNMKYEFEPMTQFVDEHPVPMIPQISNQTPRVMRNFGGEEPPQYINLSLPKMDQKRKKVEINPYIYYERPNPFVNVMGAGFQGNARLNNKWDLTGGMNVGRVSIPTENFSQYLKPNYNIGLGYRFSKGGQHGGLDRWFAEKWVDVKTGKACGRQEGENRAYPACRPSKRVSSQTPKTSSEMSSSEKAKFKSVKQSSQRIPYNHKRK